MEELMGYELEENTFNCPYFTVCYEHIYSTENPKHVYPPFPPFLCTPQRTGNILPYFLKMLGSSPGEAIYPYNLTCQIDRR